MMRRTGSFIAFAANGRPCTIYVYTEVIDVSSFEGPGEITGKIELQTSDGMPVERRKKGDYRISYSGEILTSSSPDAP